MHSLSLEELPHGSPSRSLIKRCALRSLFFSLEVLSLSKSRRVPLAALQVAFCILLHSMPPSSCVYFFYFAYLKLALDGCQNGLSRKSFRRSDSP